MAKDYTKTAATAKKLLDKFGAACVFSRTTGAALDPATGTVSGGTVSTITGSGVRVDYAQSEIDGTVIQRSDFKVLFEGLAGVPLTGDKLLFGGLSYRVMTSRPLSPAGVDVIYTVQVRV